MVIFKRREQQRLQYGLHQPHLEGSDERTVLSSLGKSQLQPPGVSQSQVAGAPCPVEQHCEQVSNFHRCSCHAIIRRVSNASHPFHDQNLTVSGHFKLEKGVKLHEVLSHSTKSKLMTSLVNLELTYPKCVNAYKLSLQ